MPSPWSWILGALVALVFLIGSLRVINERRPPLSTLAWVFAMALLPIVGLLAYGVLGPRRFVRPRRRRKDAQAAVENEVSPSSEANWPKEPGARALAELGLHACGAATGHPRRGELELFTGGDESYAAILAAIDAAEHHIHLEYYIWKADRVGTRLRDALVRRAKQGIAVRLIVDAVGSESLRSKHWTPLRDAGAQVVAFNPLQLRLFRRQLGNFRTHRKIVVVDGRVAFTGGINVSEVHSAEFSGEAAWRDTHVRLEGPAAHGLQTLFLHAWADITDELLSGPDYFPALEGADARLMQVVASGPDDGSNAIHKLHVAAIATAERRVLLTTPYLVPDGSLSTAMATARLRGVEVHILTPLRNDIRTVGAAARSYYPDLLAMGVRIHEYAASMLHAKTLVVDERVAVVGTANSDPRSYFLNFEVAVAIYEADTAQSMADQFARDLEKATEVTRETIEGYGPLRWFGQSLARLLSPVL